MASSNSKVAFKRMTLQTKNLILQYKCLYRITQLLASLNSKVSFKRMTLQTKNLILQYKCLYQITQIIGIFRFKGLFQKNDFGGKSKSSQMFLASKGKQMHFYKFLPILAFPFCFLYPRNSFL